MTSSRFGSSARSTGPRFRCARISYIGRCVRRGRSVVLALRFLLTPATARAVPMDGMSERPNLYWRNIIRQGFYRVPTGPDPESAFLNFVQRAYLEEKGRATALGGNQPNLGLFTLAAALLTFGRLDVVGDLLGNLPPDRNPARILVRSVSALVPLPDGLAPLVDAPATAAWIEAHRQSLRWSEAEGRFAQGGQGAP